MRELCLASRHSPHLVPGSAVGSDCKEFLAVLQGRSVWISLFFYSLTIFFGKRALHWAESDEGCVWMPRSNCTFYVRIHIIVSSNSFFFWYLRSLLMLAASQKLRAGQR